MPIRPQPYRLLLRLALVALPFALAAGAVEVVLWQAGETVPIARTARLNRPGAAPGAALRGLVDQQTYRYRYEQIHLAQPDVLVLGSSRVQRFRREMFGCSDGFYNASGILGGIADLETLVQLLPQDRTPRALLLGLDLWWLNPRVTESPAGTSLAEDVEREVTRSGAAHLIAVRSFIQEVATGTLEPSLLGRILAGDDAGTPRYGLLAWSSRGFRADGSLQPFDRTTPVSYTDRESPPVIERVRRGTMQFTPAAAPDPKRLARLEQALETLAERGATPVGYLPPWSSEVRRAIADDPAQATYRAGARRALGELFIAHGWPLVDASEPERLGAEDRFLEDGFHAMETYHLLVLRDAARNRRLRDLLGLDPHCLDRLIAAPGTDVWFPVYPEEGAPCACASPT